MSQSKIFETKFYGVTTEEEALKAFLIDNDLEYYLADAPNGDAEKNFKITITIEEIPS